LLSKVALRSAESRIAKLAARWAEIVAVDLVREEAERLLRAYPLRAADALQLGAACIWAEGKHRGRQFVSLDNDLITAARLEGFDAIVPTVK
jgi:predicted nucleic acid-binding protein